jgi:hypothetical protein
MEEGGWVTESGKGGQETQNREQKKNQNTLLPLPSSYLTLSLFCSPLLFPAFLLPFSIFRSLFRPSSFSF